MYDLLRGPMMWVSVIICVAGLSLRLVRLLRLTAGTAPVYFTSVKKDSRKISGKIMAVSVFACIRSFPLKINRTILGTQPLLAVLSFIFHVCLIIIPVSLLAHNILFFESWGIEFFSFPEIISDILTEVFLACAVIFLIRRLLVPEVRAVTGLWDYILLLVTVAPFITGFLAYNQLFEYKNMIILHVFSGELMLMAIGVTKLGHMVFFFFSRFFLGGEYGFKAAGREWIR
ncbi:MAG: hypothetical protein MUC95_09915 [Spirochaetes bacterium]|nr:hypothetical protein [Spirochaetota bacterium]